MFKVPTADTEYKALLCLVPPNPDIASEPCTVCAKLVERVYSMEYYGWGQYFTVACGALYLPNDGEPVCFVCASELWFRCACCQRIAREFRGRSRSFMAERNFKGHWFHPLFCRRSMCRAVEAVWIGTCWGRGSPAGWTIARDRAVALGKRGAPAWGSIACLKVLLEHESRNCNVRRRGPADTARAEAPIRDALRADVGREGPA